MHILKTLHMPIISVRLYSVDGVVYYWWDYRYPYGRLTISYLLNRFMRAIIVGTGYFHSFTSNTVFTRRSHGVFDNGKHLKNKLKKQTTGAGIHRGQYNDRLTAVYQVYIVYYMFVVRIIISAHGDDFRYRS